MKTFEFKSQICTTKEQSEALLKLGLKKETADMTLRTDIHTIYSFPYKSFEYERKEVKDVLVPAWSLHRLLLLLNCSYIELDANNPFEDCITRIEFMIKESKIFNKDYLEKL